MEIPYRFVTTCESNWGNFGEPILAVASISYSGE
jgi:hypothetical protein